MKRPSKNILKTLLFSAAMSLIHGSAKADKATTGLPLSLGDIGDGSQFGEVNNLKRKVIKNVYTIKKDGELKMIASHRSHSSHRSHRSGSGGYGSHSSHVSHSSHSSSTYGGSSHYSSTHIRQGSSSRSSTPNSLYSTPSTPKKTIETYSLGDRTLSSGLYGADVTELTMLLVSKNYLNRNLVATKSGHSLFDANVVTAVKNFQKDANLSQTGKVDSNTAAKLQSWSSSNTTIRLGVRDLAYSDTEIEGYDVTELVELLKKAGYAPNPELIKKNGDKTVFTEDIATAVKMFQAYNGLPVTGEVDSNTLTKLRAKAK